MKDMNLVFIILVFIVNNTFTTSVFAGIFRHDVPLEKFQALAKQKQFDCVGQMKYEESPAGSAVVISKNWGLTTAHTFDNRPHTEKFTFEVNGQIIKVSKIIIHPDYKTKLADLALFKLEINYKGKTAALFKGENELGLTATIVGFGFAGKAFDKEPKLIGKIAGQNVIDGIAESQFKNVLSIDFDSPTNPLLSKSGDKTPLDLEYMMYAGDSGGGLFVELNKKWYLAGINNRFLLDREKLLKFDEFGFYGSESYYARLSLYKYWIKSEMKK